MRSWLMITLFFVCMIGIIYSLSMLSEDGRQAMDTFCQDEGYEFYNYDLDSCVLTTDEGLMYLKEMNEFGEVLCDFEPSTGFSCEEEK